MITDLSKIESYLAEKDLTAAGALIKQALAEPLTSEEKGGALADLAETYLTMMNDLNRRYIAALEEAVKGFTAIDQAQARAGDAVRVAEIKESLKK